MAESAIKNEIDMSSFQQEKEQEETDIGVIAEFRTRMLDAVSGIKMDLGL